MHVIMKLVWDYIKSKWPTFCSMDYKAKISEIFQSQVFACLKSCCSKQDRCELCGAITETLSEIFINYDFLHSLLSSCVTVDNWSVCFDLLVNVYDEYIEYKKFRKKYVVTSQSFDECDICSLYDVVDALIHAIKAFVVIMIEDM